MLWNSNNVCFWWWCGRMIDGKLWVLNIKFLSRFFVSFPINILCVIWKRQILWQLHLNYMSHSVTAWHCRWQRNTFHCVSFVCGWISLLLIWISRILEGVSVLQKVYDRQVGLYIDFQQICIYFLWNLEGENFVNQLNYIYSMIEWFYMHSLQEANELRLRTRGEQVLSNILRPDYYMFLPPSRR